jgi:NAD(P)-dependent dehydrogenase (short-subunit alcohol dehydrogenase family)
LDNGNIVIINDIVGLKWLPLASDRPISPAYAISKGALTALTESLRLELAQNESNIKVIVSTLESHGDIFEKLYLHNKECSNFKR